MVRHDDPPASGYIAPLLMATGLASKQEAVTLEDGNHLIG